MKEHRFESAEVAKAFILSGNAYFTLRSLETDVRYTFRVKRSKERNIYWVSTLYGPDNTSNYSYVGMIGGDGTFLLTGKSRFNEESPQCKAFKWTWGWLNEGVIKDTLEVWHEGRCGVCGRKLTDPKSIAAGIGPECAIKEEKKSQRPGKIAY